MITPLIASLFPFIYFDVELITISAPSFNGCVRYADATVLSIISGIPASCAMAASASMSATSSFGFPIVSANTSFVFSFMADFTSSRLFISTNFVVIP